MGHVALYPVLMAAANRPPVVIRESTVVYSSSVTVVPARRPMAAMSRGVLPAHWAYRSHSR